MAESESDGRKTTHPLRGQAPARFRTADEAQAHASAARAILSGVSLETVLPQIGRAAYQHVAPEFVVLGTAQALPSLAEAWEGPSEWRTVLDHEPFVQLWRRSFEHGRREELDQAGLHGFAELFPEETLAELSQVLAIPIEARGRIRAVLMAGFAAGNSSGDAFQTLDPYALLAAFALDREAGHEELSIVPKAAAETEASLRSTISDLRAKLFQSEKMAALGHLVSGVAHELNNPLTSIQGYAQLLLNRSSVSDRRADARKIHEEAGRAARIVRNLLLFSRETKPERRPVDLNVVVERTLALRAYELKIENILVDLELDAALPRTLADAAQLQQVLLNLIINAEQAIQEERSYGRIRITTRRLPAEYIELEVSDDGPGIPREIHASVFDPFFTTKPVGMGTGLGLSIVYGIVHEHYGEVSIHSEPGQGATVKIQFRALPEAVSQPAASETAERAGLTVSPSRGHPAIASQQPHILVLEDEPTVAQLIVDVLSQENFRVETLLDSRKALNRMNEQSYDLVICDLKMPHLDGPSIYRTLTQSANPLRHRLLFVTGDTMSPRTLDFLNSCGLPCLAKPFLVEELKHAVHNALAGGAAQGAGPRAIPPQEIFRRI